jgi:carboxyl-terminal processing protease
VTEEVVVVSHWFRTDARPFYFFASGLVALALLLPSVRAEEQFVGPPPPMTPPTEHGDEYYELLRLFADTFDQVERNYVTEVDRRELMEGAIQGMLSKLDPYSNYIGPTQLDKFRSGVESEFGGVGLQVNNENGVLTVVSPIYNTPAYKAGIQQGDKLVEIAGESALGMPLDKAVSLMKGRTGTSVAVKFQRGDAEPKQYELKRELVQVATVVGDHRNDDHSWNFFFDKNERIGYIRITQFARHTGAELKAAMESLKSAGVRGLVLDLRYNPGGLLPVAIEVSDLFVEKGRIVSTAGRNVKERAWEAKEEGTFSGFPMAILVNHYSASASEIVSACLQDHERAVVVGERSWGKGSVQNIIDLENGKSALKLTTAGYKRPSGKNIHRREGAKDEDEWGVKPNDGFEVILTDEEQTKIVADRRDRDIIRRPIADGEAKPELAPAAADRQLEKAIGWLKEKMPPAAPVAPPVAPDVVSEVKAG